MANLLWELVRKRILSPSPVCEGEWRRVDGPGDVLPALDHDTVRVRFHGEHMDWAPPADDPFESPEWQAMVKEAELYADALLGVDNDWPVPERLAIRDPETGETIEVEIGDPGA